MTNKVLQKYDQKVAPAASKNEPARSDQNSETRSTKPPRKSPSKIVPKSRPRDAETITCVTFGARGLGRGFPRKNRRDLHKKYAREVQQNWSRKSSQKISLEDPFWTSKTSKGRTPEDEIERRKNQTKTRGSRGEGKVTRRSGPGRNEAKRSLENLHAIKIEIFFFFRK